ncbi:DUF4282 domain-containing protein [Rhodococcus gannanensis]|uniref:DUF4282 domain-containing protein n=1 Tax=Rhodococcus gannanensis TaxID=1960308 RepID=A0ABW4P236_9NOCA
MTTGGPTDQPGQPYGQEGHHIPPQQPGYPTPPPAYGAAPGYGAPTYSGFPPAPPTPPTNPQAQASGFFQALFDFNFNSYVTPKVVKVLYILLTVLVSLYVLIAVVAGFGSGEPVMGLVLLITAPVIGLILLALFRISLEFYVAVIKISEDVKELKARP